MKATPLIHSKQLELFRPPKKPHSLLFVRLIVIVKSFLFVTDCLHIMWWCQGCLAAALTCGQAVESLTCCGGLAVGLASGRGSVQLLARSPPSMGKVGGGETWREGHRSR